MTLWTNGHDHGSNGQIRFCSDQRLSLTNIEGKSILHQLTYLLAWCLHGKTANDYATFTFIRCRISKWPPMHRAEMHHKSMAFNTNWRPLLTEIYHIRHWRCFTRWSVEWLCLLIKHPNVCKYSVSFVWYVWYSNLEKTSFICEFMKKCWLFGWISFYLLSELKPWGLFHSIVGCLRR